MALKFLNTKIITLKYYAVSVIQILTFICITDKIYERPFAHHKYVFLGEKKMKKILIKVLSVLLVVTIFATSLPFSTLAVEENADDGYNVSTDMGDMSMTATNSFGEMLTESLSEQTNEQNNGYYISDIEYEGYCALVSFVTQQDCTIRVAVYEEDTGRMVTTASADVLATDTEAIVEFEDELPDYFVLKAFMLDENVAPLCKAYTCNEMTQMYEEFIETTVEDYPEDKVINLDESIDNNFLVMSEDTTTVTTDDETNVLISYDAETCVYTFGNIDNQIKSLKKDDIFYFDNGNVEELTFIKVGAIEIDGTTAYITEAETSIEETFDVVKLNNQLESANFEVDEEYELEDGITYIGSEEVEDTDEITTFGFGDETNVTLQRNYTLDKEIKPEEPKKIGKNVELTGSIKVEGSAGVSVTGTFKFYVSKKFSEVELTLTPKLTLNFSVEGVGRIEIGLKPLDYGPIYGIYVGISPKFIVEASVTASFNTTLKFTLGVGFNTTDGLVDKSEKPSFKPEFKIEGKIFIGVDLAPRAYALNEKIAKVELGSEIGAQLTATLSTDNGDNHLCDSCLDGDIDLVGDLTGKLVFGEKTKWEKSLEIKFLEIKIDIVSFYNSYTYDKFGWGRCPYNIQLVEFGSYPQSEVTSTSLLSALNSLSLSWKSYGYYSGTGDWIDGQMTSGDYMKYADVTYKGEKYRAVKFTEYRPSYTGHDNDDGTYQDDNGYYTNTVYWFKFEPLMWRVLDPDEGFMMCESIIDSQPYNNTIYYYGGKYYQDTSCTNYANDYATSSIRDWLNDDFYNTAFTSKEKEKIQESEQDNSCWSSSYPEYDSDTTYDKIFLLSYDEVKNSEYGFSESPNNNDTARRAQGTDYAKAQGLRVNNYSGSEYHGNSWWWLRSPNYGSHSACGVYYDGYSNNIYDDVSDASNGVRPALKLNPKSEIPESKNQSISNQYSSGIQSDNQKYLASKSDCVENEEYVLAVLKSNADISTFENDDLLYIDQKTAETENISFNFIPKTTDNFVAYVIGLSSETGAIEQEIITPSQGHSHSYTAVTTSPTCTTQGYTTYTCSCGDSYVDNYVNATGHKYTTDVTAPTCTSQGYTTYTCSCGDSYVADYVDATGHRYTASVTTPATHFTNGVMTYTCTCGDSYTEEIAKTTEHVYNAVTTAPTCTAQGYTTYTCGCGDSYVDNYVNATGHADDDGDGYCDACGELLDPSVECDHNCHKGGISGFFWKIANFFNKLFRTKQYCECGAAHY